MGERLFADCLMPEDEELYYRKARVIRHLQG